MRIVMKKGKRGNTTNAADTMREDICEIDGNQRRDERIDQRIVEGEQIGTISVKEQ
jgi:hypothetical protein